MYFMYITGLTAHLGTVGGTPPFPPSHVYFYRSMNMQVPLLCVFLDRSGVLLRGILGFKTTVVGLTFKMDGTKDESA